MLVGIITPNYCVRKAASFPSVFTPVILNSFSVCVRVCRCVCECQCKCVCVCVCRQSRLDSPLLSEQNTHRAVTEPSRVCIPSAGFHKHADLNHTTPGRQSQNTSFAPLSHDQETTTGICHRHLSKRLNC